MFPRNFISVIDAMREMDRIQRRMNRVFGEGAPEAVFTYPALNLWTNQEQAMVTAELPGFDSTGIEISVNNGNLTLKGQRKPQELKHGEVFHRQERPSGEFQRTIQIPFRVDANKVKASFCNGILHVILPRAEEEKPKRISISAE